jgi:hypothetical protein
MGMVLLVGEKGCRVYHVSGQVGPWPGWSQGRFQGSLSAGFRSALCDTGFLMTEVVVTVELLMVTSALCMPATLL